MGSIRAWSRQSATCRATEVTFRAHHTHFVLKNTWFPRLPQHGDSWTSPNIDPKLNVQLAFGWTSLNIARATKTDCATCMQPHQILRLPRTVFSFTLLFLSSTILCFCSSFSLRFFGYDSLTLLYYLFALLFFELLLLTLLFFDSTMLLFYLWLWNIVRIIIGNFSTKLPLIVPKGMATTTGNEPQTLHFRPSPLGTWC